MTVETESSARQETRLGASDARWAGCASAAGRGADVVAIVIAVLIVAAIAILSVRAPLHSDDFMTLASIQAHPSLPANVWHWYNTWNGGMTGLTHHYFALRFPVAYGVANSAVFALLVVATLSVALGRLPRWLRRDLQLLALVLAAYWFALPAIGETVFWRVGAGYLWATVLVLLFVYPYRRWLSSEPPGRDRGAAVMVLSCLGMFVFGLAVGAFLEQGAVALAILFVVLVMLARRRRRRIPLWLMLGVLGAVVGVAVLVLAPGNGVRMAASQTVSQSMPDRVLALGHYVAAVIALWLPRVVPWLLLLVVAVVPSMAREAAESTAPRSRGWLIWAAVGLATLAPFVVTPRNGSERTLFLFVVFLTVAILSTVADGRSIAWERLPSLGRSLLVAGVLLCLLGSVAVSVRHATVISDAQARRAEAVRELKARGVRDVVVPAIEDSTDRAVRFQDLTGDSQWRVNVGAADYYGIDSITTESGAAP